MYEAQPDNASSSGKQKPNRTPPKVQDYLQGCSPQKRQAEKQRAATTWIYEHGASSAEIIRQVVGQKARGYAAKMVKDGLLVETPTESGGVVRGIPKFFYTLSRDGLAEAERHAKVPMAYPEIQPSRVKQRLLKHNLIAQQITWDLYKTPIYNTYCSDRRLAVKMANKVKRPDAIVYCLDDSKTGIEIELTSKWAQDLDEFILGIISLLEEQDESIKIDHFRILSDSPAILDNYKAAMKPGMPLNLWNKDSRGRWESKRFMPVPQFLSERVFFHLLDDWEKNHRR